MCGIEHDEWSTTAIATHFLSLLIYIQHAASKYRSVVEHVAPHSVSRGDRLEVRGGLLAVYTA